jgi:hypothetical protein
MVQQKSSSASNLFFDVRLMIAVCYIPYIFYFISFHVSVTLFMLVSDIFFYFICLFYRSSHTPFMRNKLSSNKNKILKKEKNTYHVSAEIFDKRNKFSERKKN